MGGGAGVRDDGWWGRGSWKMLAWRDDCPQKKCLTDTDGYDRELAKWQTSPMQNRTTLLFSFHLLSPKRVGGGGGWVDPLSRIISYKKTLYIDVLIYRVLVYGMWMMLLQCSTASLLAFR
jgi:hypothetical protein